MSDVLLLTGGAGFVGHHLVEGVLRQTDWDIVILDSLTYAGSLNRVADIGCFEEQRKRIRFVYHNLRSPFTPDLHYHIGDVKYVWHLAANSHVDRSLIDAQPFAESTVVGTTNLLQYLREFQRNTLKRYIGFNSDECFGAAPWGVFHKETDKFYPSNPYSASKCGQWAMEYAFANSFQMPISITHSMNIIGERQNGEKFVPKTTLAILSKTPVTLHGSFERPSSRCWVHAREVCNGLLFLTNHAEDKGVYNIVGEERTVLQLALDISQLVNGGNPIFEWVDFNYARPGNDLRYALDGGKLVSMGFEYTYSLGQSLAHMIPWMIDPKNRHWLYP